MDGISITTTFFFEQFERPLTLYQLNRQIRLELEESFPETYWVIAEIAKVNEDIRKGHCYLDLIDREPLTGNQAQARCTIWSSRFKIIKSHFEATTGQRLRAGLKILFNAGVRYHEMYGLSLDIYEIDPNYTLGDLARQRQETILRLNQEGLMLKNKEWELPVVMQRLAIISSLSAAGYQDFVHQLQNNSYGYSFSYKLFPATMQGTEAPSSIKQALESISRYSDHFDAVIVIRGGGSQMDLSCFDDYTMAAAIANMLLPVITGIGHERDESIADMVANTRLKTPTAVASFLIDRCIAFETDIQNAYSSIIALATDRMQLEEEALERRSQAISKITTVFLVKQKQTLEQLEQKLSSAPEVFIQKKQEGIQLLSERLLHASRTQLASQDAALLLTTERLQGKSRILLSGKERDLDHHIHCISAAASAKLNTTNLNFSKLADKLKFQAKKVISSAEHRVDMYHMKAELLNPERQLKRGYSLTYIDGKLVMSAQQLEKGKIIETHLADGKVMSQVQ